MTNEDGLLLGREPPRSLYAGGNPCTARATHYAWEITPDPPAREAGLLREFERAHRRLPRCNGAAR